MKMFKQTKALWIVLLLLASAHVALGQTAEITGVIRDKTAAVIPNANITAVDENTGTKRTTTSNGAGVYDLAFLKPGNYKLVVQADRFQSVGRSGLTLNVGQVVSLDFELELGKLETIVEVSAEAPLISESPTLGTVINHQFVDNMPLNGRTFQALLTLVPGVVPNPDPHQFNVNGQRGVSNSTTIDGVSANLAGAQAPGYVGTYTTGSMMALTTGGTTQAIATMDELQEFTVQTTGYGAESGRQSGAQILFATKSGTNQFHGSAYEYFRNEKLDANDWFVNQQGLKRPKLRQNDFGVTFGGPILKNKTFFFLALEDDPMLTPIIASNTVPTQTYRNAASPALAPLLNLFPLPNGAIAANGLSGVYLINDSRRNPVDAATLKLDQNIGSRLIMFARYHRAPSRSETPSLSYYDTLFTNTQSLTFGATYTINPRTVNQLRFNWTRAVNGRHIAFHSTGGSALPPESALLPPGLTFQNAAVLMYVSEPSFSSGMTYLGSNMKTIQRQIQLTDSISLVRGKHKIDIGVDWRRLAPQVDQYSDSQYLIITSGATAQVRAFGSATGSGAFLLNWLSLYTSDTWKVTPRLTLNLGLRWELQPAPRATKDPQFFAAQNFNLNDFTVATLAPPGTPLWRTTYRNFAPRVGAAYHLSDKPGRDTVVRGSFGIYYDMGIGNPLIFLTSAPFSRYGGTVTGTYPAILADPSILPPALNANPPFTSLKLFDPNLQMPYTLSWNLGVQQSVGQNQSISVDYVGNRGKRLLMAFSKTYPKNPLVTTTGSLNQQTNMAGSWYDALQVQFNRRLAKGLQALANYTWSHAIDLASDEILNPAASVFAATTNRASSDFDVRHVFTTAATYLIPAPHQNRLLRAALGGWSLNPLVRAYTAKPLNPIFTYSVTGAVNVGLRPDAVAGQAAWISDPNAPGGRRLNLAAFSVPIFTDPSQLRQGTAGRNSLRGFPATQFDFAVRRDFKVTERVGLQFSAEAYNIFNHPNFAPPSSSFGSVTNGKYSAPSTATFGLSTAMLSGVSTGSNLLQVYAFGGQRDIQLSLKVTF
jgi:hypothetical protein